MEVKQFGKFGFELEHIYSLNENHFRTIMKFRPTEFSLIILKERSRCEFNFTCSEISNKKLAAVEHKARCGTFLHYLMES